MKTPDVTDSPRAPIASTPRTGSAWVDGKTHRGTDGETTARRRLVEGQVQLEIKDGDGWLRCMGDGYFTPNGPDQGRRASESKQP